MTARPRGLGPLRFLPEVTQLLQGAEVNFLVVLELTPLAEDRLELAETGNVAGVLDGDIDRFVEAELRRRASDKDESP